MSIQKKSFIGGFRFKNFQGKPDRRVIDIGIPPIAIIPLKQGFGYEVLPTVKPGDYVKAGQVIGINNESLSSPVHSSVNGTVEEITKINYYNKEIRAVKIKSDGTTDFQTLEGSRLDWEKLSLEKIKELIYMSGVTALDKGGIPSDHLSSVISPDEVENVIIHGAGSEAYNLSLSVLWEGKKLYNFIEGMKILKKVMPNAVFHLVLNKYKKQLIEELEKLTSGLEWINIYTVIPKYPQGFDEVLVPTILGKKFPYGYSAANICIVVLCIQTITQVYDAVVLGKPLIERTLALCGTGWDENIHIKVRVGTPLNFIIDRFIKQEGEYRIVLDSIIAKEALTNHSLPIDRTYSLLISIPENRNREFISFMRPGINKYSHSNSYLSSLLPKGKISCDTNVHGEERPCLSCGFCEEVCPVNIIPHLIHKYSVNNIIDERLMNYGIFNCINCNLCTFVCPSKIQLSKEIKEGQGKLINNGCDGSTCVLPYFDLRGLEEYRGLK